MADDHEQSGPDLFGFLSGLATHQFAVGIDQLNAVHQLLVELKLRGEMPERREDLRELVAPIICRSPEEQLGFHKLFDDWTARSVANPIVTENCSMPSSQDLGGVDSTNYSPRTPLIRYLFTGTLGLILLAAGAYFIVNFRSPPSDSNPHTEPTSGYADGVVRDINGSPVKNANVSAWQHRAVPLDQRPSNPDRTVTTESDGSFKLSLSDLVYPIVITASAKGYKEQSQTVASADEAHGIRLRLPTDGWDLWKSVAIAGGILSLLILVFLTMRARQLHLRKWRTAKRLHIDQLIVRGAAEWLSQLWSLRRSAQNLRRPRNSGTGDLDLLPTIEATVRTGNFSPVYIPRKETPEYLVLINRSSANDQVADFQNKIVDHLKDNGVYIDCYYYRKDPRLCSSVQSQSRVLTLQELATTYPRHNLLIFDDGSGLFHPATARLIHTFDGFSQSHNRALMSSDFPLDEYRKQKLSEIDLLVLPATAEGISGLSEIVSGGSWRPDSAIKGREYFPSVLRETEARWLDEVEPPDNVINRLLSQLRSFFKNAEAAPPLLANASFGWLAACAVYPQVSWELTLYLGYTLLPPEEVAADLPQMLRLPWFRQGSMPDWLRERLISELSTEEKATIRSALNHLLASAWNNDEGFILPISRKLRVSELEFWDGSWKGLKQKLNDWRHRNTTNDFIRSQPADSKLRDRVFLSFMVGRRPRGLVHPIPRELRRLFFRMSLGDIGTLILYTIMSCLFVGEFLLATATLSIIPMLGILVISYVFFYADIQIRREQSTSESIKSRRNDGVSIESSIKNIRHFVRLLSASTITVIRRASARQFGVAFYIFSGFVFGIGLNISALQQSVAEFLILGLGFLLFTLGVRMIGPTNVPEQLGAVGFLVIGIVTEIELAGAMLHGSFPEAAIIIVVSVLFIFGLRQITTEDSGMARRARSDDTGDK